MAYGVVYLIWNMRNGKKYVGQTTQLLKKRISSHKSNKKSLIGKAFHKYGAENFRWGIIEKCDNKEQLNEREIFWIAKLRCKTPIGYNRSEGGEGSAGCVDSEETRARKSAARLGEKNPNYGKKRPIGIVTKVAIAQRNDTPYKNLLKTIIDQKFLYSDLDNLLGLSQASFSHRMRGKTNFKEREVAKLVKIFGKSAEYLLARDDGIKTTTLETKRHEQLSTARYNSSQFKNLICEMDKHKFSYASLAQFLALDASNISRKMRGEVKFTAKDITNLVEIFGKPAEYLMARN